MKNSKKRPRVTNTILAAQAKASWKNGERFRYCPTCGATVEYKDKWSYIYAYQSNTSCKSCVSKLRSLQYDYKTKFSGENNPFYGKRHVNAKKCGAQNIGKRTGDENPMRRPELRSYFSKLYTGRKASDISRKNNSIAHIGLQSGKNNPMYGKPSPNGSGNGWANWYKGRHFRSLRELQYFISDVEGKGLSCESAQKYRIPYKSYDGTDRTYQPDFLVGKVLIEIKPKKLWETPLVKLKKEAGEKFCIENGLEYKLVDIEPNSSILKDKYIAGEITFVEKYKTRFEKYAGIK